VHPQRGELAEGARVLVIDDEPLVTLMLAKILTSDGFQVDVANDAAEGLQRAQEARPALVIVDLHMPLMDGYSFVQAFRAMPDCVEVPVILATVSEDTAPPSPQLAIVVMQKPFDLEILMATVRKAMHGHDLPVLGHDS
jgi:DNA-binding response OmpR family regulator